MRAIDSVRRAVSASVAGSLWAVLPMLVAPDRVYAAPSCGAPPAVVQAGPEQPWAQQRQALDRLTGLADGSGVLVAVIDSGVDAAHVQLAGAVQPGVDVLDAGSDARVDCVGHGTAVASIIAARPRPGVGFHGVAPGATVLPARVSERVDDGPAGRAAALGAVASAVRQAVERGARVVNLSLTTDRDDPALRDAVRYAVSRDVVVVAAAGNRYESGNPLPYPAGYDHVLGVGAIRPDGTRVPGSQTGRHVDLVAPGADVVAAARSGGHATYTGTSFAAAFVAGAAALVRQYRPELTADQVARRLLATADTLDPSTSGGLGAGMVNPYRAVTASLDEPHPAQPGPVIDREPSVAERRAAAARSSATREALTLALAGAALILMLLTAAGARRPRPS